MAKKEYEEVLKSNQDKKSESDEVKPSESQKKKKKRKINRKDYKRSTIRYTVPLSPLIQHSDEEVVALANRKKKEPPRDVTDLFWQRTTREMLGKDRLAHDSQVLMTEWAIVHNNRTPRDFLLNVKGYSELQTRKILEANGGSEVWLEERNRVADRLTETMVKRHVDLLAEVNESHISASKLALSRAIEMLSKLPIEQEQKAKGAGRPKKALRSVDIMNLTTAIEKSQNIWRKAMGLPNEESGLLQILERVMPKAINNNTQINISSDNGEELAREIEKKMSYEDVMELIEMKRALKRKAKGEVEAKDGEKADEG